MAHLTLSTGWRGGSWRGPVPACGRSLGVAYWRAEEDEGDGRSDRLDCAAGTFLAATLAGTAAAMVAVPDARGQARARPTPACGDSGGPTPPQTEGPYFKASSPLRAIAAGAGDVRGARLVVEGVVLTAACAPIRGSARRFLAGGRSRGVRQCGLSTAGPSVHGWRRPLPPGDHRARALSGPDPAHSRDGRGARPVPRSPRSSTFPVRPPIGGTGSSSPSW